MIKPVSRYELSRIKRRLITLYGKDGADRLVERLYQLIGRYGVGLKPKPMISRWDERDSVLITYGDSLISEGEIPLQTLNSFSNKHLKNRFSAIHILPFYPWSSDDGFSVIDYREVDPDLGGWDDIEELAKNFELMFDMVLNHCSAHSAWFQDFIDGIEPARHYFHDIDPETDLSQVTRPRTSPLLTPFKTRDGEANIWTTFSADQVDLNWENPDLLFEFLDILFLYLSKGVHILRFDAVAFVWKKIGTTCIHLPEAHEIVKLFRDVLEIVEPKTILLTETNVPQPENLSYMGDSDEAHMVYQFSLPPLLLHGLMFGEASHLSKWAKSMPKIPNGCTFFNFAASHDGVGVRPVEGILSESERDKMIAEVENKGGKISWKNNPDGSKSPYEMNITYFSALSHENQDLGIARFLCSQSVVLSLKGIPGIYIHSLLGTSNDLDYMAETGQNRSINRRKWKMEELTPLLKDSKSQHNRVFKKMLDLLRIRSQNKAFHPDASQTIHEIDPGVMIIERESVDGFDRILCVHNFTDQTLKLEHLAGLNSEFRFHNMPTDLISGQFIEKKSGNFTLKPYQFWWLVMTQ
ncbi:MAG: alpha-amylase family glycosyl hydrolase [Opitutales bacterium]|nr:alpha-amylase family glycosyl hydrolase [Opitutales bacterium]